MSLKATPREAAGKIMKLMKMGEMDPFLAEALEPPVPARPAGSSAPGSLAGIPAGGNSDTQARPEPPGPQPLPGAGQEGPERSRQGFWAAAADRKPDSAGARGWGQAASAPCSRSQGSPCSVCPEHRSPERRSLPGKGAVKAGAAAFPSELEPEGPSRGWSPGTPGLGCPGGGSPTAQSSRLGAQPHVRTKLNRLRGAHPFIGAAGRARQS